MEVFCDLHLHSCLSPCGDDEMTPWNLVGMACVNGLSLIALTDHNTTRNVPEAIEAGKEYGVAVLPGMEITSKEEAHILGYFPTLEDALAAGDEVYDCLPAIENDPSLFGNQLIKTTGDQDGGILSKLLINATSLSVDEVEALVKRHNGITVPAHINRGHNGMIGALGLMPFLPQFPIVEVSAGLDCPAYATKGRFQLHSSDAHRLEDVQGPVFSLQLEEATPEAAFRFLKSIYG
ncbi:MAG: PHP domain-containing protein [Clostridia bacterium]|nr:PHP domain-containing protein [Clostridia bacterium]